MRELLLNTLPEVNEEFLWGVPVYAKGRFYLAVLKKQVNFGFSIIGLNEDEIKLFEGSDKTARHIKIYVLNEEIKEKLVKLIRLVCKKAGIPK